MYRLRGFFLLLPLSIAMRHLPAQVVLDLPVPSQHARVAQTIGLTEVSVDYSRPAVKGRKIWGGLVPRGFRSPGLTGATAPWRTGANLNTVLSVEHDVKVEGQPVRAGRYGLFVDIGDDSAATVILSRTADSWGSFFYDASEDALRVAVKPKSHAHTELLTVSFDDVQPKSAALSLRWERLEVPIRRERRLHHRGQHSCAIPEAGRVLVSFLVPGGRVPRGGQRAAPGGAAMGQRGY